MNWSEEQRAGSTDLRHLVPGRWWESAAGLYLCTLKPNRGYAHVLSLDPDKAPRELAEIRAQGFGAIEIFAPAEGLYGYAGLDMVDPFRVDRELGEMEDFRRLVRLAHETGLAVVPFLNVGYFSVQAPAWLEACRDRREGRDSARARWFSWADSPDVPPPAAPEDRFFAAGVIPEDKPDAPKTWGWQYSEAAGCYFWSRWQAKDEGGNWIGLPQMDWGSREWPPEAERIIRFWMDTGIDGMIIDAPNCYQRLTWDRNSQHITGPIAGYGNTFIQAEGVNDPAWLSEGGYNCLQNYGVQHLLVKAIQSGNPAGIERSLRDYRDLMTAAGGVLYTKVHGLDDPAQRRLQAATLAGIGDMLVYGTLDRPGPDEEEQWLLRARFNHPALHQHAGRRRLPTNADNKYYAFLKTAADRSERVLVVLNFQASPQAVEVDLSGVAATGLINLKTGDRYDRQLPFTVDLPAHGYTFLQVLPML